MANIPAKEWRLSAIRQQIRKKRGRKTPVVSHTVRIEFRDDLLINDLFLTPVFRALEPERYIALIPCAHCGKRKYDHSQGKCLFENTTYVPEPKYT